MKKQRIMTQIKEQEKKKKNRRTAKLSGDYQPPRKTLYTNDSKDDSRSWK